MNKGKCVRTSGRVLVDLTAAGRRLWELHAQERGWEQLSEVEQDQMIREAEEIVLVALGARK